MQESETQLTLNPWESSWHPVATTHIAAAAAPELGVLKPRMTWAPGDHWSLWEASFRRPGAQAGFPRFIPGQRSQIDMENRGKGSPRRLRETKIYGDTAGLQSVIFETRVMERGCSNCQ